ncbi:MAG: DUF2220 domain-containing protein [Spirochaetaceae bacterium]|nr:DUF2220 domain-containing protein [Spirochaetaceae bacterium]MCF7950839.1 DUF2220 domain-containing protein [Spirochaetaceae bacterium]
MSPKKSSIRKLILKEFENDYPYSAQIRGGRALRKGRWERTFPGIESDPQVKDEFISAAEELETEGVLTIKWVRHRRGDRIEALYLKDPRHLYQMLGLPSPEQQREESLALLKEFRAESGFTEGLIEHLQARLEAYIPTPCGDPQNLADLLELLAADRSMSAELPLRALSIRLYNDSKRLERLLPQVDKLSMAACGEKLSARLGLARNYPQAALRGQLELVLQDGQAWKLSGDPLFFGSELTERLALISAGAAVLVVENKETFMTLPFEKYGFAGLVYGGGHLNSVAGKLMQIVEQSGIKLYYFGDLDPDGLLIFQQAESLLSGQLIPWHMDAHTYRRYVGFGYFLSEGSLARLSQLYEPRFADLSELIYQHGRGVEQEVIDVLSPVE